MVITWGNLSFEELQPLSTWDPPTYGGVYAITFRPDYKNKPMTHRIIYFGKADHFNKRGINDTHHKYNCWKKDADGNQLYVSIHQDDNDASREKKEIRLIEEYTPSCNDQHT